MCGARLGVYAAGESHSEAVALLGRADSGLEKHLRTLLNVKSKVAYTHQSATSDEQEVETRGRSAGRGSSSYRRVLRFDQDQDSRVTVYSPPMTENRPESVSSPETGENPLPVVWQAFSRIDRRLHAWEFVNPLVAGSSPARPVPLRRLARPSPLDNASPAPRPSSVAERAVCGLCLQCTYDCQSGPILDELQPTAEP